MRIEAKQPVSPRRASPDRTASHATRRPAAAERPAPTTTRKAAPKPRTRPARVASGRLAGWGDLGGAPVVRKSGRVEQALGRISTRGFVLLLFVCVAAFTAYEAHVYATRASYAELQKARRENLRLHLKLNRLKGEFDAATAPSVVVARARALGLVDGIGYGPTLRVDAP